MLLGHSYFAVLHSVIIMDATKEKIYRDLLSLYAAANGSKWSGPLPFSKRCYCIKTIGKRSIVSGKNSNKRQKKIASQADISGAKVEQEAPLVSEKKLGIITETNLA